MIGNPSWDLFERWLSGDEKAFNILYDNHIRLSYKVVSRFVSLQHEKDDLVQQVWEKIILAGRKQRYHSKGSFHSWLARIAARTCIDWYRRSNEPTVCFDEQDQDGFSLADILVSPDNWADLVAEDFEFVHVYADCRKMLDERARKVWDMKFQHGTTHEEIATKFNVVKASITYWIQEIKDGLTGCLQKKGYSIDDLIRWRRWQGEVERAPA